MQTITPQTLLAQLSWRYAVKVFDPSRKIPADLWSTLEQAIVLAPTSYGLQPWCAVVVADPAVRAKLREASWNQPQITDASHLVVFARQTSLTEADINRHVDRIAQVRGASLESLAPLRGMIAGSLSNPAGLPGGSVDVYTTRQTYIGLGVLITAAALLGVDACPMEGFDPSRYNEILGLPAKGYSATVVATLGYRAADDWLAKLPKVRPPHEQVIRHV